MKKEPKTRAEMIRLLKMAKDGSLKIDDFIESRQEISIILNLSNEPLKPRKRRPGVRHINVTLDLTK